MNKNRSLFLFCRSGYENDCAAEIQHHAKQLGLQGYCKAKTNTAYVLFYPSTEYELSVLMEQINFDQLIFTRQWFEIHIELQQLPEDDRLSDITSELNKLTLPYRKLLWEVPDAEELKPLNRLTKSLNTICNKQTLIQLEKLNHATHQLHICFVQTNHCFIGYSAANNSHTESGGVMMLKLPQQAPSRSMLKLDEALRSFFPKQRQAEILKSGMSAVDFGAAPGGWTWLLTQYQVQVTAVDNGTLNPSLLKSNLVDHIREDAFNYIPELPVDWLVSDIADKPKRVFELIQKWINNKWAENFIFILKLPMQSRYRFLKDNIMKPLTKQVNSLPDKRLFIKHLSHDRNEITIGIVDHANY